MRLLTWNLERKKPTSPTGRVGVDHLFGQAPDVMVLTESRLSFPAGDGYLVASESWGDDDERKVVMWSRAPWTDVDMAGAAALPPGRFVAATTDTDAGPVRVFGVCISWHMANVRYGNRNRRPWEDHIAYCHALGDLVEQADAAIPLVVAGDFNQRVPAKSPESAHAVALERSLASLELLTTETVAGVEKPGIDHIAVRGVTASRTWGWSNVVGGIRCSDHTGAGVDLTPES